MKKLSRIKLTTICQEEMSDKQMSCLTGGYFCVCGACGKYDEEVTVEDNKNANSADDLKTDGKCSAWYHWNTL